MENDISKKSKTKFGVILLLSVITLLIIAGVAYSLSLTNQKKSENLNVNNQNKLIGGDTDEHGCLAAAGYGWCELKSKCLRFWEEPCLEDAEIEIVSKYIKENISELSSEHEVLGGKFYVTNIRFTSPGHATVDYEDGHIALQANADYVYSANKGVIVEKFLVQEAPALDESKEQGKPIGGERDEHGCLGPAGYSYNAELDACVREWEITDAFARASAKLAMESEDYRYALTLVGAVKGDCVDCYTISYEVGEDRVRKEVLVKDGKLISSESEEKPSPAVKVVSDLAKRIVGLDEGDLSLNDAIVKWNTEDGERVLEGRGISYGKGVGAREVFEIHLSLLEEMEKMGYRTDSHNTASSTPDTDITRVKNNNIVCNVIRADMPEQSASFVELRCADWSE